MKLADAQEIADGLRNPQCEPQCDTSLMALAVVCADQERRIKELEVFVKEFGGRA